MARWLYHGWLVKLFSRSEQTCESLVHVTSEQKTVKTKIDTRQLTAVMFLDHIWSSHGLSEGPTPPIPPQKSGLLKGWFKNHGPFIRPYLGETMGWFNHQLFLLPPSSRVCPAVVFVGSTEGRYYPPNRRPHNFAFPAHLGMRDWDVRLEHTQMARCKYPRNALHVRKEGAVVKGVGKGWIKRDLVMGCDPKQIESRGF